MTTDETPKPRRGATGPKGATGKTGRTGAKGAKGSSASPGLEALVAGLAVQVTAMNRNLVVLAEGLNTKPSRVESTYRRRLSLLLVIFLIFITVQTVDVHTENCGPGRRSEEIVDGILTGKIDSQEAFREVSSEATPSWFCGATFPTHTHDGQEWPEPQHMIGLLAYLAFFGSLAAWVFVPFFASKNENTINTETLEMPHDPDS